MTVERPERSPVHIARWDLDKTYLRTDFDTVRDLVRTAFERADEKRANPGAAALLRELQAAGAEVHVLSGSPEQMRKRLAAKLRLDGVRYASLTLKPSLENLLRLRLRSLRGQLGYKLPALLSMRAHVEPGVHETLVGDDAEADAFIYALYADLCAGVVGVEVLQEVMTLDRCHPEEIADAVRSMRWIGKGPVVDRILIHLDRQTPPGDFSAHGARLVPFYNYFQAALVLHEDGRIPADAVLRVGTDLVLQHRFDGDALVRSFLELARRGHLSGRGLDDLAAALGRWPRSGGDARGAFGLDEVHALAARLDELRRASEARPSLGPPHLDYVALVAAHDRRRRR